jgi:hypothetical protein
MKRRPTYRVATDPAELKRHIAEAEHLFVMAEDGSFSCAIHDRPAESCHEPCEALVWESELDGGTYKALVTRTGAKRGHLVLTRGSGLVFERDVYLMYGARSGPDIEDVQLWQRLCVSAADDDYRRRGQSPPS